MFRSENSTHLLVGKSIARTASVQIDDPATAGTYIADGEIVVLDDKDVPFTGAGTATYTLSKSIRLVQGRGTAGQALNFSPKIDGFFVVKYEGTTYSAPVAQVTHIGNVGSGALELDVVTTGAGTYVVRINYTFNRSLFGTREDTKPYVFTYTVAPTQEELADDIVAAINADTSALVTAAKTSTATEFGVSLTGKSLQWSLGKFMYNVVSFQVALKGFGTTPVTYTTNPSLGNGAGKQIAELEWFCMGGDGAVNRSTFPMDDGRVDVVPASNYDIITITCNNTQEDNGKPVSGQVGSPTKIVVAMVTGASQGDTGATAVQTILNAWMASIPRPQSAVAL